MAGGDAEVEDVTLAVVELVVFMVLLVLVLMHLVKRRGRRAVAPSAKAARAAAVAGTATGGSAEAQAQLQAAITRAFANAGKRDGKVELRVQVARLPALDKNYEDVVELTLPMASSDMDLAPLRRLPNLTSLTLTGPPLRLEHLQVVRSLPNLRRLHLGGSRVVVDANNSITGFCKPKDVFEFARSMRGRLDVLELPDKAAYEVARVVKVFKKAMVVVVAVSHSLAISDRVYFNRTTQQFAAHATSDHIWNSKKTCVSEIRTDDHTQLQIATHNPDIPSSHIDNQVAIKVVEAGRPGDAVMWCGVGELADG